MMLYIPNNINIDVIYIYIYILNVIGIIHIYIYNIYIDMMLYTQCYWGLIMIKRGNGKSF